MPPTIFTHVKPDAVIAREEIFGPVLAVIKVRDLDEALAVANASEYALTGGIFSPRRDHRRIRPSTATVRPAGSISTPRIPMRLSIISCCQITITGR